MNTGMPDDYKELQRRGISVKDKIVIARYGGGWRGLKPKLATEHGAIGCLIYSDPRDDGFGDGDVWLKAARARRKAFNTVPFFGSYPSPLWRSAYAEHRSHCRCGARFPQRGERFDENPQLSRFPMRMPNHCSPLYAGLSSPVVGVAGGLPITYHFGPGPARVHLPVNPDRGLVKRFTTLSPKFAAPIHPNNGSCGAITTMAGFWRVGSALRTLRPNVQKRKRLANSRRKAGNRAVRSFTPVGTPKIPA